MNYTLPFRPEDKVAELGGGDRPRFRPNFDVRPLPTVDHVFDLSKPFPITEIFDGVYCAYALEHLPWRDVKNLVSESFRILKPGGIAVFIVPNTRAQMQWALKQEKWDEKISQCIFGDQDYPDNTHRAAFSPDYIFSLFREQGFDRIIILPHGELKTDMIVEATKTVQEKPEIMNPEPPIDPTTWTTKQRKEAYNRDYFDGGRGPVGGYSQEGYWDYPVHWLVAKKLIDRAPVSVLELGAARGYVLKKLEDQGIQVKGLEISDHCQHTKAIQDIVQWDITKAPWPIRDQSFDLCFSIAVMEHIPENKLDIVIGEIKRTCRRAIHAISFTDDNFDKTHTTLKSREWWFTRMPPTHEVYDKEEWVRGDIPYPEGDKKVKLNIGSFTTMFHHGWTNMDKHPLQAFAGQHHFRFIQADVRMGLAYQDNSVDMVYMHHFLEHLGYKEGEALIKECTRVLKPGGLIRIIMPDVAGLIAKYRDGQMNPFDELNQGCAQTKHQVGKLWELLFSGHSSMYDFTAIQDVLKPHFKAIEKSAFRKSLSPQMLAETLDILPSLSLFVEAVK